MISPPGYFLSSPPPAFYNPYPQQTTPATVWPGYLASPQPIPPSNTPDYSWPVTTYAVPSYLQPALVNAMPQTAQAIMPENQEENPQALAPPIMAPQTASNPIKQVRASHILVDTEKEANRYRDQILSGKKSFEDLAKAISKCPSGKSSGGDLGFFGHDEMDKAFETAAFSLPKGVVSEPVKSQFGWHLIKVTDQH